MNLHNLKIKCKYSDITISYNILTDKTKPVDGIHPLLLLPLPELERLLACTGGQSDTSAHLLLVALLRKIPQVRFDAPLSPLTGAFYPITLPRVAAQIARLSRINLDWPGFVVSKETQGETPLLQWLDVLEGIDSPGIAQQKERLEKEVIEDGIEKIIQYIWHSPAIRAKKEWIENKLRKTLPQVAIDSKIKIVTTPENYPAMAIAETKATLLDHCTVSSEHDGNMLSNIIRSLDKALLRRMSVTAAVTALTAETDKILQEIELLERTTHWKNQDAAAQARAAVTEGQLVFAKIPEPKPENFSSPTAYKIALARFKAQK